MPTTTTYGTWRTYTSDLSVEATIDGYVAGGDADWYERVRTSGALERMAEDFREAVNAALPEGVSLHGDEIYGPAYEQDRSWQGELDIRGIIDRVDLAAIVARHDPDRS